MEGQRYLVTVNCLADSIQQAVFDNTEGALGAQVNDAHFPAPSRANEGTVGVSIPPGGKIIIHSAKIKVVRQAP